MDPAVIVTLVISVCGVIFASITAPLILAHRTEKMHREDRLADYARQDAMAKAATEAAEAIGRRADNAAALLLERQNRSAEAQEMVARRAVEVAEQAREAARLLAARQEESAAATARVAARAEEAARLLAENTALVAESASETGKKLDTIHALVNSNMTQAMQSEFEAVSRELASMKELIALRLSLGQEPTAETRNAVINTQGKLAELELNLAERAKIQEQVNRKIGLDVITTTSYRRAGDEEKTSVQVNQETQGVGPPGDDPQPVAGYAGPPPDETGESRE